MTVMKSLKNTKRYISEKKKKNSSSFRDNSNISNNKTVINQIYFQSATSNTYSNSNQSGGWKIIQ